MASLVQLAFSHNELSGQIPVSIGNLSKLEQLFLNDNQFNGSIPKELGNLSSLVELLLLLNRFNGSIPDSLGNLTNLEQFALHDNKLSGYFPETILNCKKLKYLTLGSNSLVGPVPKSICSLRLLETLHLGNNLFSGSIPQCVGNFSHKLTVLDLRLNRFHGNMPATFLKQNNSLKTINLNGNELHGSIPTTLIDCTNLEVLDLGDNKLTGLFPHWIDTLPHMQVLVLRGNKLNGTLHTSNTINPFQKLRILDLSSNEFIGSLPSYYFENFKAMMSINKTASGELYMGGKFMYYDTVELGVRGLRLDLQRISVVYTTIDLSVNKFEGDIPDTMGELRSLRFLNLSHNSLTGGIPVNMKNLVELQHLDLCCNKIVGKIPAQLVSLTFLAVVNFSYNQLQGGIPRGGQFNTFENSSFQGNNGLCGFPLTKNCGDNDVPFSTATEEDEHEDDSFFNGFSWESVVLGYGFGTLFGLGIGRLVFHFGKPRWVMMIIESEQSRHARKSRKIHEISDPLAMRGRNRSRVSQVYDVRCALSF
ncbi:hypothetical protein QVD17_03128 [Tagetes erecta]|uniref:Uncharacterized protein n=1 Tax=Tagetes erecta TaxID=13708 RepID=A0AAD8LF62_TARER|nr:hypothetical protein QVD17_03128 [Tagetes erecta]